MVEPLTVLDASSLQRVCGGTARRVHIESKMRKKFRSRAELFRFINYSNKTAGDIQRYFVATCRAFEDQSRPIPIG